MCVTKNVIFLEYDTTSVCNSVKKFPSDL